MGHRGEVVDGIEIPIALRTIGQEIKRGELPVDVDTGDNVTPTDDHTLAVIPALVVLDLDIERIEALMAGDADK